MQINNLVGTTRQMNYAFIFNKTWDIYRKFRRYPFYKKNEEWKNNLENVLQIVWEFLI